MDNDIFRKKSMERVSSPEQLNSYIKVCKPMLWVVLLAIMVLLVGAVFWSIFGKLDTTITAVAVSKDDKIVVYIKTEDIKAVKEKNIVIDDKECEYSKDKITYSEKAIAVSAENGFNAYILEKGDLKEGEYVYVVTIDEKIDDNIYLAKIVTDSISPISFIINK